MVSHAYMSHLQVVQNLIDYFAFQWHCWKIHPLMVSLQVLLILEPVLP